MGDGKGRSKRTPGGGRSEPSSWESASLGPEPRVRAGVSEAARCAGPRGEPEGSRSPRVGSLGTGWGRGESLGWAGREPAAHPPCHLADSPSAARLGPRPQPTGAAAGTQDAPLRRLRCSNMAARCAPEVRCASASGPGPALVTLDPRDLLSPKV